MEISFCDIRPMSSIIKTNKVTHIKTCTLFSHVTNVLIYLRLQESKFKANT